MAQLKATHINGILTIDPDNNTDKEGGSNKRLAFAAQQEKYLNKTANNFDVPVAYAGPQAPMKMDLGTSEAPWLRTHTRAIRFYASNPVEQKPSNIAKPKLAGRIWIPDDTAATDTLVESTLQLQLGNKSEEKKYGGEILMYNKEGGSTLLIPPKKSTKAFTEIILPDKAGTLALDGHTHNFHTNIDGLTWKHFWYSGSVASGTGGGGGRPNGSTEEERKKFQIDTKGTIPTPDQIKIIETKAQANSAFVKLKNCFIWGSDDLDIFVIRGYASVKPIKNLEAKNRRRITLGHVYVSAKNKNILPAGLVPMSVFRKAISPCANGALYAAKKDGDGYSCEIAVRYPGAMKAGNTYGFYFTATYGKLGVTDIEDESDDNDEKED